MKIFIRGRRREGAFWRKYASHILRVIYFTKTLAGGGAISFCVFVYMNGARFNSIYNFVYPRTLTYYSCMYACMGTEMQTARVKESNQICCASGAKTSGQQVICTNTYHPLTLALVNVRV